MKEQQILLASNNVKKLDELRRILAPLLPRVTVLGLADVKPYAEPAETESTFEGNALLKARAAYQQTALPSLADDSGLCVDALNQMPGVLSARWSGVDKDAGADAANNALLLAQLADVPDDRRGARFVCAAALCSGNQEIVELGEMFGRILRSEQGTNGFGYDPLFAADGQQVSNAELDPAVKDSISHRGKALTAIGPHVHRLFS